MTSTPNAASAAADAYLNPISEATLFDSAGVIAIDLPCRGCEYNLRGLPRDSRCPECGIPCGLSTHGDLLRFADPDWLRKLSRGISYLLWGILVAVLANVAGGALGAVTSPVMAAVVGIVGSLLGVYGAWLVTERDPSGLGEDRYGRTRRIIRFALIVGLFAGVIQVLAHTLPLTTPILILLGLLGLACGLIGIVGEYCKLVYFEKLALRIPDYGLSRRASVVRRWLIVIWALMLIAGAVGALFAIAGGARRATVGVTVQGGNLVVQTPTGGTGRTAPAATAPIGAAGPRATTAPATPVANMLPAFGCVGATVGVLFLAVMLAYIRLLLRLRKSFCEQTDFARATWAAAGEPV
ncbi:MAG: hypothetical protein AB7Q17_06945 [Phycisphaerae bacterium]